MPAALSASFVFPKRLAFILLGLAGLSVALRWSSLGLPLERDEGVYATLALAWQRGWGLPYTDFFDHKPPLLYALYRASFQWLGWTPTALRLASLLWQTLSVLLFACLLWDWTRDDKSAALGGLAFAALSHAWLSQGAAANAEGWALLPLLLGLACLRPLHDAPAPWRWVAWGFFSGAAACIKQPYYLFTLGLPLLWQQGALGPRLRAGFLSLAGLLVAHMPWLLYLGSKGALGPAWQAIFSYHSGYGRPFSWGALLGFGRLLAHLSLEQGAFWCAAALALWPPLGRLARLGGLFLLLGLAASGLSGRWYPHYALFWSPGLALLAAAAWQRLEGRAWRWALGPLLLLPFLAAQSPYWRLDAAGRSRRLYATESFVQAPALAAWLQQRTAPDARLFIWGADAELYFLARRRPAGRFLSHYSYVGYNPGGAASDEELLAAARDPRVGAAVLSDPLDPALPLQRQLAEILGRRFEFKQPAGSAFSVGLPRAAPPGPLRR